MRHAVTNFGHHLAIGLHAVLIVGAAFCVSLLPAAGEAAMLVPISAQYQASNDPEAGPPAVFQWLNANDAALLGASTKTGVFVVRMPSDASILDALALGLIPITASSTLCGPIQNES